jgi:hypothetical protein
MSYKNPAEMPTLIPAAIQANAPYFGPSPGPVRVVQLPALQINDQRSRVVQPFLEQGLLESAVGTQNAQLILDAVQIVDVT